MKKEEYEAHKKDYKNNGISLGAYILIQDIYIVALESKLEELMKHKTCDGCCRLYFDEIEKVYKCCNDVSDDVGYLHGEAVIRNIKDFCCNEYKPKA